MENSFYFGKKRGLIDSVTKEKTKIILKQMENSICKVFGNNIGTGFFCLIPIKNEKIPVLKTNYHIIDESFIQLNNQVKIQLNNDQFVKYIAINKNKIIYSSENGKYDLTIIKIDRKENIYYNQFLELDDVLFNEQSDIIYEDKTIYILNYNNEGQTSVSYGYGIYRISQKNNYNFIHKCNVELGSCGSPILNLTTNKVLGIHKSICEKKRNNFYNLGTILNYPLIEFEKIENQKLLEERNKKNIIYMKPKALLFQKPIIIAKKNINEDKEEKNNNLLGLNSKNSEKSNKNVYGFNKIKKEFNISKNSIYSKKKVIENDNSIAYKETNVDSINKLDNLKYFQSEKKQINKYNITFKI